jgi:pilus assembly protein CpaF
MCTIHADSSAGVFRRLASYAVQAPERLPVEATSLLVAGAVHFVVFLDVAEASKKAPNHASLQQIDLPAGAGRHVFHPARRVRFVASVREVIDADGMQVVSNEIFKPGPSGRAVPGSPIRTTTLNELMDHGYEPGHIPGDISWL